MTPDLAALLDQVRRAVDRGAAADGAELLAALDSLRELREQLAALEPVLITAARTGGTSWASLAPAMGVASRQAAERRYLRLRPSTTGEATGEGRVDAERDRRAGERAVATWARANSTALRRLAGQISALDDLAPDARHDTDRLDVALGANDAADLIDPLTGTGRHLGGHHDLADQVASISAHTHQLRDDAQRARRER